MRNIVKIFSILLLVITVIACDKTSDLPTSEPLAEINKPTADNAVYASLDTVWLSIDYSDEDELHRYDLTIINTTDNTVAMYVYGHTHGNAFRLDTFFVPEVQTTKEFKLEAMAKNHNLIEKVKTKHFSVMP